MLAVKFACGAMILVGVAMGAHSDDVKRSKAVKKDGISSTISVTTLTVPADGQPAFKIRFENASTDYINLYDADAYWKWQFVFERLDAPAASPRIWKLKFDVISQDHGLAHKQVKPGEACETTIDLANDPAFTFTFINESDRKEKITPLRHLQPGKYQVKATVSLEAPLGPGFHHWTGPLTTETVQFMVLPTNRFDPATKKELAAYEKALQPVIKLTQENNGLWLNGGFPDVKVAKTADPEDVVAGVVNANRLNLDSKTYRVLFVKRLSDEDGKRFVALISVGKTTKAMLCFPISDDKWWSRCYDATVE